MRREELVKQEAKKKLRLAVETLRMLELSTVLGGVEGDKACETRIASGCA
jgi:hypothetical protein